MGGAVPLTLRENRRLARLVLRHLLFGVLLALAAESVLLLRYVDHLHRSDSGDHG